MKYVIYKGAKFEYIMGRIKLAGLDKKGMIQQGSIF